MFEEHGLGYYGAEAAARATVISGAAMRRMGERRVKRRASDRSVRTGGLRSLKDATPAMTQNRRCACVAIAFWTLRRPDPRRNIRTLCE